LNLTFESPSDGFQIKDLRSDTTRVRIRCFRKSHNLPIVIDIFSEAVIAPERRKLLHPASLSQKSATDVRIGRRELRRCSATNAFVEGVEEGSVSASDEQPAGIFDGKTNAAVRSA
jgi:hypothetical protein